MSAKAVFWATDKKVGDPVAKYVLITLCQMSDRQYQCWPKNSNLASKTELGERTVRRAISYLIKSKLIHSMEWVRDTDSGSTSNVYTMLVDDNNALPEAVNPPLRDCGKAKSEDDTPRPNRPPTPCLIGRPPVATQAAQESKSKGSEYLDKEISIREEEEEKAKFMEGFNRLPKAWQASVLKDNPKIAAKFMVVRRSDLDGYLD